MAIVSSDKLIIGNAGGIVKTRHQVADFARGAGTRVNAGASTLDRRLGNRPRSGENDIAYYDDETGEMDNSIGLRNDGADYWDAELPEMKRICDAAGKDFVLNIAEFSPQGYLEMTRRALKAGVRIIQLNGSCQNNKNKAIVALDPDLTAIVLEHVSNVIPSSGVEVEFKVAPVHDPLLVQELSSIFANSGIVNRVVVANAEGGHESKHKSGEYVLNYYFSEDDQELRHVGSKSGSYLTQKTPELVALYFRHLPASIGIIACGGIKTGEHAWNNIQRGAIGIEMAAECWRYGPQALKDMSEGLAEFYAKAEAA